MWRSTRGEDVTSDDFYLSSMQRKTAKKAWQPKCAAPGLGCEQNQKKATYYFAFTWVNRMKPLSFVGGISKRPKSEPPVVIVRLFGTRGSIVAARRGPRFTEMRDDCPNQYHAEGSLCRQRSSRRRLSTVSMRVKEKDDPRRRNPSIWTRKTISQLRPCPPGVT